MKRALTLILALCFIFTMFAACGTSDNGTGDGSSSDNGTEASSTGGKVIKIGIFEPASGDNGAAGKQETLGYEYAHSLTPTVDIDGETYTVELEYVDNESSTDKAATAASTLISKGVSIVLGSYGSAVCIASSQVFADAKIPVLAPTSTNPQVTLDNTHYFRMCFLDPFQGTVLANFAVEQFDAKNAYVLAKLGDDYSVGLATYFRQAFEELGGTVTYETFPEGTSDYNSYVVNAKNSGADIFFSPTSTEAAALIIEQATAQGWDKPILAGDTWDSNVITSAATGKDITLYITTFYQEGGNIEFDSGFKDWLNANSDKLASNNGNDQISAISPMAFDAYYVALEAIKSAGSTDSVAINEALWDVQYNGVTGHIEFDEIGDAKRSDAVVKKVNSDTGLWEYVTTQGVK
ncbi:MAG: ABC transporter substrate-binding protein [Oscillospiraceae bacterium]|jgi:branched-chain amino acid transport system substrate-binding protein|nr:ABC transporter substrate-binding protein [Oscillospiraceae bacterium]